MDEVATSLPGPDGNATNSSATSGLTLDAQELAQSTQEATELSEAWSSQTYQTYECVFDPSKQDHGIVRSFTTNTTFNTTVGESRLRMGIKDDMVKMTNGRENNYFKATKWYFSIMAIQVFCLRRNSLLKTIAINRFLLLATQN